MTGTFLLGLGAFLASAVKAVGALTIVLGGGRGAGLALGADRRRVGRVIGQRPRPGTIKRRGGAVVLVVGRR